MMMMMIHQSSQKTEHLRLIIYPTTTTATMTFLKTTNAPRFFNLMELVLVKPHQHLLHENIVLLIQQGQGHPQERTNIAGLIRRIEIGTITIDGRIESRNRKGKDGIRKRNLFIRNLIVDTTITILEEAMTIQIQAQATMIMVNTMIEEQ